MSRGVLSQKPCARVPIAQLSAPDIMERLSSRWNGYRPALFRGSICPSNRRLYILCPLVIFSPELRHNFARKLKLTPRRACLSPIGCSKMAEYHETHHYRVLLRDTADLATTGRFGVDLETELSGFGGTCQLAERQGEKITPGTGNRLYTFANCPKRRNGSCSTEEFRPIATSTFPGFRGNCSFRRQNGI